MREIGKVQAVLFVVLASSMLYVLYTYKEYLMQLVVYQSCVGAFLCMTILLDQAASTKLKESVGLPELLTGEKDSKLYFSTVLAALISAVCVIAWY